MVPYLVKAQGGGDERKKDQGRMAVEKGDGGQKGLNSCNFRASSRETSDHLLVFPVYFTSSILFSDTAGGHKKGKTP